MRSATCFATLVVRRAALGVSRSGDPGWAGRAQARGSAHARHGPGGAPATPDLPHERHTYPFPVPPNLPGRQFMAEAPDRVWLADLTYIATGEGWLYLAVVRDLYTRRVVGWAMIEHLGHELALAALDMAIERQRPAPGLIAHSDRGVQYASDAYLVSS